MRHRSNASLKALNSLAIEARADQIVTIHSVAGLQEFAAQHIFDPQRDLILGGGSNILLTGDIEGTVVLNRMQGKNILSDSEDEVLVEVCAGENWHELVLWSLDQGLSGLENLSLIPGLAGAAPIQNIGAYGVELADVLEDVEVFNFDSGTFRTFTHRECQFTYRSSRFKSCDANPYMITRIRLKLRRKFKPVLHYSGLRDELTAMGVSRTEEPTAIQVSEAVIRIRQRKLPDPSVTANAGSFFKNPVVCATKATQLKQRFNHLPVYPSADGRHRLSAAWMIEQCGWKGRSMGRAAVSAGHALVLVNTGGATGDELLKLSHAISASVNSRFGIDLETEPCIV